MIAIHRQSFERRQSQSWQIVKMASSPAVDTDTPCTRARSHSNRWPVVIGLLDVVNFNEYVDNMQKKCTHTHTVYLQVAKRESNDSISASSNMPSSSRPRGAASERGGRPANNIPMSERQQLAIIKQMSVKGDAGNSEQGERVATHTI